VQEKTASAVLQESSPEIATSVLTDKAYVLGNYQAIDPDRAAELTDPAATEALAAASQAGQFDALGTMTLFPTFMLVCYIGMFLYFKSQGGYQAQHLTAEAGDGPPSDPAADA